MVGCVDVLTGCIATFVDWAVVRIGCSWMAVIWFVGGTLWEVDHWFFQMHFLLRTTVLFVLCVVAHVVISLATAAPKPEKLEGMIWTPKLIEEETKELAHLPWYLNYRYLSVGLLAITAWVVWYFW